MKHHLNKLFESKNISLFKIIYAKVSKTDDVLKPKFDEKNLAFYYDNYEAKLIWQFVRRNKYYVDLWSRYEDTESIIEKLAFKKQIYTRFLLPSPISPMSLLPKVKFIYFPFIRGNSNNLGLLPNEIFNINLAEKVLNKLGVQHVNFNKFPNGFYQYKSKRELIKFAVCSTLKEELGVIPNAKYISWALNEKIFKLKKLKNINANQLKLFKTSFAKISAQAPLVFFD